MVVAYPTRATRQYLTGGPTGEPTTLAPRSQPSFAGNNSGVESGDPWIWSLRARPGAIGSRQRPGDLRTRSPCRSARRPGCFVCCSSCLGSIRRRTRRADGGNKERFVESGTSPYFPARCHGCGQRQMRSGPGDDRGARPTRPMGRDPPSIWVFEHRVGRATFVGGCLSESITSASSPSRSCVL